MDYLPHELRAPVTGILAYSELRVVTALEGEWPDAGRDRAVWKRPSQNALEG